MSEPTARRRPLRMVALVGAGVAAGVIGATAWGAAAQSTSTSTAPNYPAPAAAPSGAPAGPMGLPPAGDHGRGPGGATPVRPDEKNVSSSQAATLRAAALQHVPGGTVIRIETDSGDAAYEVHMSKADGSLVTVKFDKALKFVAVEPGMGR